MSTHARVMIRLSLGVLGCYATMPLIDSLCITCASLRCSPTHPLRALPAFRHLGTGAETAVGSGKLRCWSTLKWVCISLSPRLRPQTQVRVRGPGPCDGGFDTAKDEVWQLMVLVV
jgi:hypothetical protein